MKRTLLILLIGALSVAGCGREEATPTERKLTAEEQIEQIKNNPTMPANAKQDAIAELEKQRK